MLLALKFGNQVGFGRSLGCLLAEHPGFDRISPDALIPVPLHPKRLDRRGYNQALEIAAPLARRLRVPIWASALARVRNTAPQSGFNNEGRQKNIHQAFRCTRNLHGRHLLLVDDTLTTGATLQAAGTALLQAGAAKISVAVVSRTARHYEKASPRGTSSILGQG